MVRRRPLVIVTRKLPEAIETRMMELFDTRLNESDAPPTKAQLIEAVKTAEVLVPTVTDSSVLAHANPKLRLIANYGTGVDHIDIEAAYARGITVTNTPGVLTEDTADMTMALILAVARRLVEGERIAHSGEWLGWSPTWMLGHRITGKRLGILGMGRIGSAVARRARGFGLAIHYHDRRRVPDALENELEATYWESLDQMLARMDIISVNCPHTPATFHLLSARRLKLLRPQAIVVNTSRGEVIDEAALTRMLQSRELAGAGLDVFEHEPAINPKLRQLANVVLLPHMSSATIEGRLDMGEKVPDQHQDLCRRSPATRPRAAQPAVGPPPRRRVSPCGLEGVQPRSAPGQIDLAPSRTDRYPPLTAGVASASAISRTVHSTTPRSALPSPSSNAATIASSERSWATTVKPSEVAAIEVRRGSRTSRACSRTRTRGGPLSPYSA
jgi:glyoxylate reductase